MQKCNILVTGVGAIIGYGVILSLRKSKYNINIIGMDIFDDAVGQVWCDKFIQAKPAADKGYISFLQDCIKKYHIDLVFFGTEQEIQKCYEYKKILGGDYEKLVLNTKKINDLSSDKWETICFLKENGQRYIPSSITLDFEEAAKQFKLPLLMKPRRSYASKGIKKVFNRDEFEKWKEENQEQFMVQMLIGDDEHEYTTAIFGFGDGTCTQPIILRRKLSKAGATDKAFVEKNQKLNDEIYKLVQLLKPVGPTNFQFRLHEGEYFLLEINPRISSSTSIRTAFGYNEAEMCIDYFIGRSKPQIANIRSGSAVRYITEVVNYNDSDNI